jgi:DNA polymerase III alpha subunit (gram-positive type)
MQSNYKTAIVYDTETGGLKNSFNSLTELAFVAVDMETLEAIDEMEVMILPYLDLTSIEEDSLKEAKELYKYLSIKDETTGKKVLTYKNENLSIQDLGPLSQDIELFKKLYLKVNKIIDYKELVSIEETDLKPLARLLFDKCYNPGAFAATGINRQMLLDEGVDRKIAFEKIESFFLKHTKGNSKPILSGHNIRKFDNPFMEKFFALYKKDFNSFINATQMIDTLEWARLKWFNMSSFALGVVANEVGITLKGAHRAIHDTRANAKLFIKMLSHLRGEGTQKSNYKRRKFKMNF